MTERSPQPEGARWNVPDWSPEDHHQDQPYLDQIHELRERLAQLELENARLAEENGHSQASSGDNLITDEVWAQIEQYAQDAGHYKRAYTDLLAKLDEVSAALALHVKAPRSFLATLVNHRRIFTKNGADAEKFVTIVPRPYEPREMKFLGEPLPGRNVVSSSIKVANNAQSSYLIGLSFAATFLLRGTEGAIPEAVIKSFTKRQKCRIPPQSTGVLKFEVKNVDLDKKPGETILLRVVPISARYWKPGKD